MAKKAAVVAVNPANGMGLFQYLETFFENKIPCTVFAVAESREIRTNSGVGLTADEVAPRGSGLRQPLGVEREVAMPLHALLDIPVRLTVTDKADTSHCVVCSAQLPATFICSMSKEPTCFDPRTSTSLPTAATWRNMSHRLPAMVISSTACTIFPSSTQKPAAPRE